MTDPHPFFRIVWRLNALLILAVMAVAGVFVAYNLARDAMRSRAIYRAPARGLETPLPSSRERTDAPPEVLHVGAFMPADGPVFQAPLYSGTAGDRYKYVSGVKGSERVRNILFFHAETGAVRRLFSDDKGRVVDEDVVTRSRTDWPRGRTLARVYVYVPADTNGDGRLDAGDKQRVVITRPDGSQPLVLAEDVDRYGAGTSQDGRETVLSYFIRRGGELHYGEFDLLAFTPGRSQPVKVPPA